MRDLTFVTNTFQKFVSTFIESKMKQSSAMKAAKAQKKREAKTEMKAAKAAQK